MIPELEIENAVVGIETVITPDHEHYFLLSWDKTYRKCKACAYEEWNLACWTDHTWSHRRPDNVVEHRPDLKGVPFANNLLAHSPNFVRSHDLIPERILKERIHIIGAGSIGSFTALALVKMGFKDIHIWDDQDIGRENVSTQLYGDGHVGRGKTDVLKRLLTDRLGPREEHGLVITEHYERYVAQEIFGVVICAVDSMESRKQIWKASKRSTLIPWLIDARMGAEQALLYTMKPSDVLDIKSYGKTLYSDDEALQEPCTAAGTAYTALLIAGMIGKAVKDVLTNQRNYPRIVQWSIRDNHQLVHTRPVGANGEPVPFKVSRNRKVKKNPWVDPWTGKGIRHTSGWKPLNELFTLACERVPFVVEWLGKHDRPLEEVQKLTIAQVNVADLSFFPKEPPADARLVNGRMCDSAQESRFRLLFAETIAARELAKAESARENMEPTLSAITTEPAAEPNKITVSLAGLRNTNEPGSLLREDLYRIAAVYKEDLDILERTCRRVARITPVIP